MNALVKRLQSPLIILYVTSLCTSMSGMEIFSVLLAMVFLADFFSAPSLKINWKLPPHASVIFLLIGIIWLSIFLGDATPKEKWYDAQRVRFFFIYFLLYYLLERALWKGTWFKALVAVSAAVAVYGSFQHFIPLDLFRPEGKKIFLYAIQDEKIGPLVIGTFNHHLTFSNVFVMHACVVTAMGLGLWPQKRYLLVLGFWLFLICIWTDSRAAWVAIPFTVLVVGSLRGPKVMLSGTLIAFMVLAAFYFTDRGFNERFKRTLIQSEDLYSLGPRTRLWKAQFEMFKERPLLGVGYNNNERKAKVYVDRLYPERKDNFYGHAHSNILQLLASTGILGCFVFIALWCQILISLIRFVRRTQDSAAKALGLGVLAAFIGFHIQGITQWNFGDAEVLHNLMFYWAVAAVLSSAKNDGSKKFLAI